MDCPPRESARSPLDIPPAIFAVADAFLQRSVNVLGRMGRPVSCGPGRPACCSQLIPVSARKALLPAPPPGDSLSGRDLHLPAERFTRRA